MGKIKGPKAHALTVQDGSSHQYHKSKDKEKRKSHANPNKEGYSKPVNDASGSKGGKGIRGEKCTYCHKGFHPKSDCMQKKIRYNESNTLVKQPWRSHPQGCQEEEARRLESQERQF